MWKEFIKIFIAVFIAELGDKTQLAVLGFASTVNPKMVFLSASLALVSITAMGAAAGFALGKFIPQKTVQIIAGALFIIIGILYIWKGFK
ncbi:UPF0016 family protein [bacterium]|nr:MAG: UPF0016 family protein [bacterium]